MRQSFWAFIVFVLFAGSALAESNGAYPYVDAYKATVYGTPPELRYSVDEDTDLKTEALHFKARNVPDVFFYSRDMYYTTALQKEAAPLVFIVAGTGAEHDSSKMRFLSKVYYEAGYHVVGLSSPTHMNFVVAASQYAAPGYVPHDVADLYRVMVWIKEEVGKRVEVQDYSVTGYSLGALHSAFLAHLDSERGDFDFRKVVMINPPVSLYHSMLRLDSWLGSDNLGDTTVHDQIDRFVDMFSDYYEQSDVTDLDDDFLYELITHIDLEDKDLRALIGVDFRVSSSAMIFASDVCLKAGYVVPQDAYPLSNSTPLMPYAEAAFAVRFQDYMEEYLLPYLNHIKPGLDRWDLIRHCSLYDIRDYLKKEKKVVVIGNVNDPILNDYDLQFIDKVFGDRAVLYPVGGHCGNMMYTPFVEKMLELMKS